MATAEQAWDEGYAAAESMAKSWGHVDWWQDPPENPYRGQVEQVSEQHVIQLREDGWTIMHPLSCRPNLFECRVNVAAVERDLRQLPLGRYECGLNGDGKLIVGPEPLPVPEGNYYRD